MSLEKIKILTMNPHFFSLLVQGFLSGYKKPCDIKLLFMAVPILLHEDSRKRLASANKKSKIESIYNKVEIIENEEKLTGKSNLAGYYKRYEILKPFTKKILIILSSKNKIVLKDNKVYLLEYINYKDFSGSLKRWVRIANYLGIIFSETNEDSLNFFLGVEKSEKLYQSNNDF